MNLFWFLVCVILKEKELIFKRNLSLKKSFKKRRSKHNFSKKELLNLSNNPGALRKGESRNWEKKRFFSLLSLSAPYQLPPRCGHATTRRSVSVLRCCWSLQQHSRSQARVIAVTYIYWRLVGKPSLLFTLGVPACHHAYCLSSTVVCVLLSRSRHANSGSRRRLHALCLLIRRNWPCCRCFLA